MYLDPQHWFKNFKSVEILRYLYFCIKLACCFYLLYINRTKLRSWTKLTPRTLTTQKWQCPRLCERLLASSQSITVLLRKMRPNVHRYTFVKLGLVCKFDWMILFHEKQFMVKTQSRLRIQVIDSDPARKLTRLQLYNKYIFLLIIACLCKK